MVYALDTPAWIACLCISFSYKGLPYIYPLSSAPATSGIVHSLPPRKPLTYWRLITLGCPGLPESLSSVHLPPPFANSLLPERWPPYCYCSLWVIETLFASILRKAGSSYFSKWIDQQVFQLWIYISTFNNHLFMCPNSFTVFLYEYHMQDCYSTSNTEAVTRGRLSPQIAS